MLQEILIYIFGAKLWPFAAVFIGILAVFFIIEQGAKLFNRLTAGEVKFIDVDRGNLPPRRTP